MKLAYSEFLDTVKVLKMLYGSAVAKSFFENNIRNFDKTIDPYSLSVLQLN